MEAWGHREETGRDAQSRRGAFQGGQDGFLPSGSKGSTLDSEEQLLAPSYPHTQQRFSALSAPQTLSHTDARCCPLLGAVFLSHLFYLLSAASSFSPLGNRDPVGTVEAAQRVNLVHCQHTLLGSWEKSRGGCLCGLHGNDK